MVVSKDLLFNPFLVICRIYDVHGDLCACFRLFGLVNCL